MLVWWCAILNPTPENVARTNRVMSNQQFCIQLSYVLPKMEIKLLRPFLNLQPHLKDWIKNQNTGVSIKRNKKGMKFIRITFSIVPGTQFTSRGYYTDLRLRDSIIEYRNVKYFSKGLINELINTITII